MSIVRIRSPSVTTTAVVLTAWVALVLGWEAWSTLDTSKRILWLVHPQTLGGDLEGLPWLTWAVAPALFAYVRHGPWLDREWFGVSRWQRRDWRWLGIASVAAVVAAVLIPLFPTLQGEYRTLASDGAFTEAQRTRYFAEALLWILSWLPVWEFMTRGLLLPFADRAWPRYGWLAVPVLETAFHFVKPWPEAVGMLVFSTFATRWAKERRNLSLPFLAHLLIELAVCAYVAFGAPLS